MNFHRSRLAFAFVVFCHQSLEFVHRSCTLKTTAGIACWCFRGHVRPEHRCLAQFSAPSGAVLFLRCSFDACCFHATVCRTTAVFFFVFFNHKCSLKERGGAMSAAVYWLTHGLTLPLQLAFRDKVIALFLLLTWALTCAPLNNLNFYISLIWSAVSHWFCPDLLLKAHSKSSTQTSSCWRFS